MLNHEKNLSIKIKLNVKVIFIDKNPQCKLVQVNSNSEII